MMLAPFLLALLVLTVAPFAWTIATSFTDFHLTRPANWKFVGSEQYVRVLTDSRWWTTLARGLLYIAVPTALQMLLGLTLALLLHKGGAYVKLTRPFFLLPMVLPPIVVGVIWKIFLLRDVGGLHQVSESLGIPFIGLLETAEGAVIAIILILVWEWTPFVMLLLLAGLEALPEDAFEAARIDGATFAQELRYITLPLFLPTILVVLLFRILESTKVFPIIFSATNGGPGQATENMDFYAYLVGFRYFDFGYAASLLVMIMIVFAFICLPLLRALSTHGSDMTR